jgi:multidrug efflux pump subunit AcrB
MAVVIGLFVVSVYGFRYIDQSFFPPSTRPQFMVDLWFPQGQHIDVTTEKAAQAQSLVEELPGVTHVTSFISKGGLRFLLTYTPEKQNSAYAQLLVDVEDAEVIDGLIPRIEEDLDALFGDATVMAFKFELGPGANGKVRPRFSGPDPDVLRDLADQTIAIMEADGNAKGIRTDWRQRVKNVLPVLAEQQANLNGITRTDVAATIAQNFEGVTVGLYREGDLLLPIVVRAPEEERMNVANMRSVQIWSPAAEAMIPLLQVVSGFETVFEDEMIWRKDRKRTINVYADPRTGPASALLARIRPAVEDIPLPVGYELVWGGEYEDSADAQGPLFAALPAFVLTMIIITIALFNSLRQPAIIWLNVPMALIGVTGGLLSTGQPFGFMALLGFLSLMGMLIKNAVVLIDEINLQQSEGRSPREAVVGSAASRLRPVAMAASTTALGMIPLLFDAFFVSMAVTIIAGLIVGTVLTMVVLPVSYSIFFRIPSSE